MVSAPAWRRDAILGLLVGNMREHSIVGNLDQRSSRFLFGPAGSNGRRQHVAGCHIDLLLATQEPVGMIEGDARCFNSGHTNMAGRSTIIR
ncbi:hypothetical protein [Rhizobium sp. Root1204]|uniref:hypothetical protein n=1 Tax=Rhizobium sp. Root1204 TaxID=1736428 RepID=UPI00076198FC|nr:hypothetical protein [Rhizobium sp. Root1204]